MMTNGKTIYSFSAVVGLAFMGVSGMPTEPAGSIEDYGRTNEQMGSDDPDAACKDKYAPCSDNSSFTMLQRDQMASKTLASVENDLDSAEIGSTTDLSEAESEKASPIPAGERAPFYSCAHRVNCVSMVDGAIKDGHNCIEIDLVYWSSYTSWYGDHGGLVASDTYESCDKAEDIFKEIAKLDTNRQIVLIWLDFKNFGMGIKPEQSAQTIQKLVREKLWGRNILYGSLHNAWHQGKNSKWLRENIDPSFEGYDFMAPESSDGWKTEFDTENCWPLCYENGWSQWYHSWRNQLGSLKWAWEHGAALACHWTETSSFYMNVASLKGGNVFIVGDGDAGYSSDSDFKTGVDKIKKNAIARQSKFATTWVDWTRRNCRCQDLIPDCATHKKNAGCTAANADHASWRKNCVRTCEYCSDPRYTCEDLIPGCAIHKKNGGCSEANGDHDSWRKNCVRTCGYCSDPRYTCQDLVPDCAMHQKNFGCSDTNADHETWRKKCVRTCGYCSDPKYTCQDNITGCAIHKKNGGCSEANADHESWRKKCVATCGYCLDPRYN